MNNKKSSKTARKPRAAKNHDQSRLDQVEAHSSISDNDPKSIEETLSKSKEALSEISMMSVDKLSQVTAGFYQFVNQFSLVRQNCG